MIRLSFLSSVSITIVLLSGCNSSSGGKEIARETAERDAVIAAAKSHPASAGDSAATGKPLPPLPGVNAPAPKAAADQKHEHEHNHQ
jgi:hypothetical protein